MEEQSTYRQLFILIKLAEMGAHRRTTKISTEYLAKKMGTSQQTASRYLIDLDQKNWIKRTITPEGCLVRITEAGTNELQTLYSKMRLLMEAQYPPTITLEGTVFTGIGEGAYYISNEGYRKQFIEKLGFDPYPGTLNLRLNTDYDIKTRSELEAYPSIEIEGFKREERSFGPVKCYPVILQNTMKAAIITALRSHYDVSVIEVISPVNLRKHLKLKDGYKVKVEALTLP